MGIFKDIKQLGVEAKLMEGYIMQTSPKLVFIWP